MKIFKTFILSFSFACVCFNSNVTAQTTTDQDTTNINGVCYKKSNCHGDTVRNVHSKNECFYRRNGLSWEENNICYFKP